MAVPNLDFRNVAILSTLEFVIALKFLLSPANSFTLAFGIFAVNHAVLLVYQLVIRPTFISQLRMIPGPKFWLPRSISQKLWRNTTQGDLLLDISRSIPNNGLIALRELTSHRLLVTKPSVIAEVLGQKSYKFAKPENMRTFLRHIVGDGQIVLEGERHKFMRKHALPAFSFRRIRNLYPLMWTSSLKFVGTLGHADEKERTGQGLRVEISRWASRSTFNIILDAIFGRGFDALRTWEETLVKNYEAIFAANTEMQIYIGLSAWLSFQSVSMLPWRMTRIFKETSANLKEACVQLARHKRLVIDQVGQQLDVLSLLIGLNVFSDDELADQLLTYLAAGHDTTALSLTWACYLLSLQPSIQSQLRCEVRSALQRELEQEDVASRESLASAFNTGDELANILESLPLLKGVINETLRLYPTVPVTIRSAVCDTELNNHFIPKGTEILISPWLINRSRDIWGDDADDFRPDRWLSCIDGQPSGRVGGEDDSQGTVIDPERVSSSNKAGRNYDFLTFLHGPRACIGQSFARAELRCLLTAMLIRFEWSLDMDVAEVKLGGAITLGPQKGLYLKMKPVT